MLPRAEFFSQSGRYSPRVAFSGSILRRPPAEPRPPLFSRYSCPFRKTGGGYALMGEYLALSSMLSLLDGGRLAARVEEVHNCFLDWPSFLALIHRSAWKGYSFYPRPRNACRNDWETVLL